MGPPGTRGGTQSPGWRAGNPAKYPLPIPPALPRELWLPPTGAGTGDPKTQGVATAPFVGFGWKLHLEAPLPALPGFEVAPTLQGEVAGFAAGQKWCLSLEGWLAQSWGGPVTSVLAWRPRVHSALPLLPPPVSSLGRNQVSGGPHTCKVYSSSCCVVP